MTISRIILMLTLLILPFGASGEPVQSETAVERMMSSVVVRAVDTGNVPVRVDVALYHWISSMLALGDESASNDKGARQQLDRLNAPAMVATVASQRNFSLSSAGRMEVQLIRRDGVFIASPIVFVGAINKNGALFHRPHVYRLHIEGASGNVLQVEEIPYHRLASLNEIQSMKPREIYDLIDQSGSIVRQYRDGYESMRPGTITDLMASDAILWNVTVDQASKAVVESVSKEYGFVIRKSRAIQSRTNRRDLPDYTKHLSRIFAMYDSVDVKVDDTRRRLFRHVAEDGSAVDILEFYQEFTAWRRNQIVYRDAGFTTFLLKTVKEGRNEGRLIIRKSWSFNGIVSKTDGAAVIADDPSVIPVLADMLRDNGPMTASTDHR